MNLPRMNRERKRQRITRASFIRDVSILFKKANPEWDDGQLYRTIDQMLAQGELTVATPFGQAVRAICVWCGTGRGD